MPPPAIRVENLGKRYLISHQREHGRSLRESFTNALGRLTGATDRPATSTPHREEFWALRGLDFAIAPGETVAIIGANGSGKSTLLKILSRVSAPTSGKAVINGRVASLLEVGTGFHPELTGRENILLNGAILGMSRDEIRRKFDAIVAFAEVEQFIDTPVKRYSSGMYTRLAFSVAAHLDCEILIIDEVLSVGDAAFQAKSVSKMTQIMQAGKTILFVSHNMAAAQKLCRNAIHLQKGRIEAMGPSPEIIANYLQSACTQSEFNPAQRKSYVPDLTILNAQLLRNARATNQFAPGEPITVELHIKVLQQRPFNVELLLRDEQGQPILLAPSGLIQEIQFGKTTGTITIQAQLPSLLLAAGAYSIDTILCHSGVCFYERIENAVRFTVTAHALGPQNFHFRQSDGFGHQIVRAQFHQVTQPSPAQA